jgi:CRISPR-associated endonuclease/helicase Cas3
VVARQDGTIELPLFVRRAVGNRDSFAVGFFVRMLYSCLVDADFLDTGAFMDPEREQRRARYAPEMIQRMATALESHVQSIRGDGSEIGRARREVREACLAAAVSEPGMFALTVPTGGGKTLSSLSFALEHARRHGLVRVVYVAPFTSIIEQNADVFRFALRSIEVGDDSPLVLEHHCNLDDRAQTTAGRLAAENWDAPLIVTTTVQFYESLFASRSSRCRKLHNLTNAVIILDEVQKIPVDLLQPTLRALQELVDHYGTTIVLCTATQPAITSRPGFSVGLDSVHDIIPEPENLYERLQRVDVQDRGVMADLEIASELDNVDQALCIVNTRHHAKALFELLGPGEANVHLSAAMCAAHRTDVLARIRARLNNGLSCRVISTQVVEAGVDLDFPVVYRALAGIDSIAQSAGRCNRNGRLPGKGQVFVFRSEHERSERWLSDMAGVAAQVMALHDDPLSLAAVDHYFRLYYWEQAARWDARAIMGDFRLANDSDLPFDLRFKTVASKYRLIDDGSENVIIPWSSAGRQLCEQLRAVAPAAAGGVLRKLQRYIVQVPRRVWDLHLGCGIELVHEQYPVLVSPELNYCEDTGLDLGDDARDLLCC